MEVPLNRRQFLGLAAGALLNPVGTIEQIAGQEQQLKIIPVELSGLPGSEDQAAAVAFGGTVAISAGVINNGMLSIETQMVNGAVSAVQFSVPDTVQGAVTAKVLSDGHYLAWIGSDLYRQDTDTTLEHIASDVVRTPQEVRNGILTVEGRTLGIRVNADTIFPLHVLSQEENLLGNPVVVGEEKNIIVASIANITAESPVIRSYGRVPDFNPDPRFMDFETVIPGNKSTVGIELVDPQGTAHQVDIYDMDSLQVDEQGKHIPDMTVDLSRDAKILGVSQIQGGAAVVTAEPGRIPDSYHFVIRVIQNGKDTIYEIPGGSLNGTNRDQLNASIVVSENRFTVLDNQQNPNIAWIVQLPERVYLSLVLSS